MCLSGLRMGRRYDPRAVRWARSRVPPHSLVAAMQFSWAMNAYGLGTLVRWDWMQAERFPRFRGRM
ncbi:MAG: hypothetical protein ABJC61_05450 [Acidobacteriota bacterium]